MKWLCAAALLLMLPAAAFASDAWWGSGWHYRIRADVNSSGFDRADWIIEEQVDFSQVLGNLSANSRLDPNSIRVVEYKEGNPVKEVRSQFDRYSPDSWAGELVWEAPGSFMRNTNRTFYIYFDTLENGQKTAPEYEKGVRVQSREKDLRIDSAHFMLYMDRTQYGYTHVHKKTTEWQTVPNPPIHDPLSDSRENITTYRGTVSLFGDHYCDPGCEMSLSMNFSGELLHEGPLRVAVRSYSDALERSSDDSSIPFAGMHTIYIYADKPYYRTIKQLDFGSFPLEVSGINRRTWILSGRQMLYAYESTGGVVKEGAFPVGGAEFKDWNGTWTDSLGTDGRGIADFEIAHVPEPRSLWIERDQNTFVSYSSALWRPESRLSSVYTSEYIEYFHMGDWMQADLPTHYWELKVPPVAELGNLSYFTLNLHVPPIVLNWDPSVKVDAEVSGSNVTIERMECSMYSEERKYTLFEGEVGEEGVRVFDVPEGRWKISCIAFDKHGHSASDIAQTQVYDVMSLVKICGASILLLFLIAAILAYRVSRAMRGRGKLFDCPRCGMPIEGGARECPVCGRKLG